MLKLTLLPSLDVGSVKAQAARKIEGNFFVLPSSVHEMLLLPDDSSSMSANDFRNMVASINADEVAPEDRLTDSVYHYDARNRVFKLAET